MKRKLAVFIAMAAFRARQGPSISGMIASKPIMSLATVRDKA